MSNTETFTGGTFTAVNWSGAGFPHHDAGGNRSLTLADGAHAYGDQHREIIGFTVMNDDAGRGQAPGTIDLGAGIDTDVANVVKS